jgi:terminase large subunit-like protein
MPDLPKPMSRTDQVQEIIKCGKDPIYFINRYVKIQHPKLGTIPFKTYPFQDDCLHAFEEHRLNIVLKSRQLGLSTLAAAYASWLAIFYKDKSILVIATKLPTAMNFIKKVRTVLQNLPPWLLLPKFEPTKQAISFSNGSQVVAIPTSDDAGRSEALSLLIIDEAAFIRDFEDIWTGLAPTFSTGGNAIILSTPHGVGGQYYKLWTQAEAGQNDFNPIRLLWDVHPEHDQAWFDKETKSLPRRRVAQEYLCDFATSGDTFLQPNDLELLRGQIMAPVEKAGHDHNVWIWSPPIADHTYVISADVSRGDAHDYSAFHVIDTVDCEVAAEYMGKVPPEKLAEMLAEWGKKYNNALIAAENNTFGYFVNVKLRDQLNYKKLYYSKNRGDPFNYIPTDPQELPGFQTDQKTRVQILTKLEEMIRSQVLKTYSQRLYDQLQAFIWNGNKPMANKDSFDDLIMSIAIACWMVEGGSGISEQAVAMAYAILAATHVGRKDFNQMPGNINEAQPLVNPNIKGMNAQSVYRTRDPSQVARQNPMIRDASNFDWLLK